MAVPDLFRGGHSMLLKLILNILLLPINLILLIPKLLLKATVASKMKLWIVV